MSYGLPVICSKKTASNFDDNVICKRLKYDKKLNENTPKDECCDIACRKQHEARLSRQHIAPQKWRLF